MRRVCLGNRPLIKINNSLIKKNEKSIINKNNQNILLINLI